jgi:hypothetical protein
MAIAKIDDIAMHVGDALGDAPLFAAIVDGLFEIKQQAIEGSRALLGTRGDVSARADAPQKHVEPPVSCRAGETENAAGDLFDVVLDAFDEVGEPLDERFEQARQDFAARVRRSIALLGAREEERQRLEVHVTHRHKPVSRQNEGHGGVFGQLRFDVMDDHRRHEVGAAFAVEAVRGLDLAHFRPRRDREAERFFDGVVLLGRGIHEVDPKTGVADRCVGALGKAARGGVVDR